METTEKNYKRTITVEEFKSEQNAPKLDIVRNPHTGNLFFSFGYRKSGALSDAIKEEIESSGKINSQVLMSLTETDEGNDLWILHRKGTNNIVLEF